MSFVADDPESYGDQVVGNGQCVAFVKRSSGAPASSTWRQGLKVRGNNVAQHTAIATFDANGNYPSNPTGQHAAIYIDQTDQGLNVWDQWVGQPVHRRLIRFRGGSGSASNDGDAFSVIEARRLEIEASSEQDVCIDFEKVDPSQVGPNPLNITTPGFAASFQISNLQNSAASFQTRISNVGGLVGLVSSPRIVVTLTHKVLARVFFIVASFVSTELTVRALDSDNAIIATLRVPSAPKGAGLPILLQGNGIKEVSIDFGPEAMLLKD